MASDSDSDSSYISATPPRNHPSPAPPQPPRPTLLMSSTTAKSSRIGIGITTTTKVRAKKFTSSRPILKPKPSSSKSKPKPATSSSSHLQSHSNPSPSTEPIPPERSISHLPFQIRRPSDQFHTDQSSTTGTLPAGGLYLSRFASFSKKSRTCLNFESTEIEPPLPSVSISSQPKIEVCGTDKVDIDVGEEGACLANLGKVVKTHPNSIGSSVSSSVPVKRPKNVNEGNFVRLNINGHGRKFTYKTKRRNANAFNSSHKSFKRSKRNFKVSVEGEEGGPCGQEKEDLDFEAHKKEEVKEGGRSGFNLKLLEEAVLDVRIEVSDENLVKLLKLTHGYDTFRDGQLEAVKMVLARKSTMLVLPTGAGKSLCYQLAAMVLPGLTLVVSPLVALMIDQLKHLPPVIQGALLCSNQTPEETSETMRMLHEGALKVLFVSPERFLNAEFQSIFSAAPLISLAVVDEAHCISEWSHNFRPSFMRLRASLLRASFNVECILAMTATATTKTLHDVMSALEIPSTNLIQASQLRDNLQLSVSMSGNRQVMKDLMALLKSSPFMEVRSIIIYCKFQLETDMISKFLRDSNILAKSYHSGLPAKDRSRTQELFCSNKIRVVVATVAFGMGLDKSDVGAVIHYSLPESLEEYVQEIGRAGRDGRLSYCHLLFDDITYFKLRSLMYSDGVDEYIVNRFLSQIFSNEVDLRGKVYSLVKESASRKFDIKEEVMLTILTRLELGEIRYLHLLPQINVTCSLNFHKTPPELLAAKDIVVAAILKKSETKNGLYVFDIPTVANSSRVRVIDISNHLQSLKMKGEITYELKDPAFCYTIVDVPKDVFSLATDLTKWLSEVEICKVRKLDTMFNAAVFAVKECDKMNGCLDCQHTPCLQTKILEYFNADDEIAVPNKMGQSSPFLRADIKVFLQSNSQAKFTPRAVARIMHGIASPTFPSATWSRTHFWGRYMQTDFKVVMEAAKAELMNFIGKDVI
ncbi:hypothetical protein LguiA_000111 [Lonicera macranthoides]